MARAMTPARRAALRKAQLASARKRKGKHKKPIGSLGHAAAVVGTYVAAGNVGTYVGMRAHMSPGVAWAGGVAAGVGSAVAVHKKIKRLIESVLLQCGARPQGMVILHKRAQDCIMRNYRMTSARRVALRKSTIGVSTRTKRTWANQIRHNCRSAG